MLLRFLALMRAILAISRLARDPKWNRQPQDRSSQTAPGVPYASVYLRRVRVNWAHSNRKAKSRVENYCSRSRFAGSTCRTRLTGPATESKAVSSKVNATATSTKGSCAEAW
jgi:hypothetical protein